jgi:ElaB/YqjD/DUF883 family membrane-anchored ribosome-binding protein
MLTSTEFRDELLALKTDAARLLGTAGDEMLKASRERAGNFAEELKSALEELSQEEKQIEKLVIERPIAALACAFAVGIAVGFALRRI